ncbi:hypothetical protein CEXT_352281 [Caerostris extrusa]|uniref:Elongator complex protein 6 n=1 Tax=Caerostris extrusa TaxID=172846 RepID=A0AAV4V566_CAEEX|nr:hypothetical protein CEXT_352281 [Caerostris extrusa]
MLEAGNIFDDSEIKTELFTSLNKNPLDSNCLKPLFECIKNAVEKVSTRKPDGFVLFIDEISLLVNLGASLPAISSFVQQCYTLCAKLSNIPGNLLIGSIIDECDSENERLINYLTYIADINIKLEGLKTGYSKETDGKISIEVKNKSKCISSHQKQLFKVTDKGTKLLPLGI